MVFSVIAVCRESITHKLCPQEVKLSLPWAGHDLPRLWSGLTRPPVFSACLSPHDCHCLKQSRASMLSSFVSKMAFKHVFFLKQSYT